MPANMLNTDSTAALHNFIQKRCLIACNAHVVHPLAPDVERLASKRVLESPAKFDPTLLNDAILRSTVVWQSSDSALLKLSDTVAVKTTTNLDVSHVSVLNHVHAHAPGLPIPHPLGFVASPTRKHLFVTFFAGNTLELRWPYLSAVQKRAVQGQLDHVFSTLRSVPPPSHLSERAQFGSGIPARCKDARRANRREASRLITDERHFNLFLTTDKERAENEWIAAIRARMREDHACVMSHGDLHAGNIIVRMCDEDEGNSNHVQVVGIIDWETSGWYPEYWDYVKALFTMPYDGPLSDWWEYLPPSIGVWPDEYATDLLISSWHG